MRDCALSSVCDCFPILWNWKLSSYITRSAERDGCDHRKPNYEPTGWKVGGRDVLIVAVFALLLVAAWLLQGFFLTTFWNATVPRIWKGAVKMTLGVGMTLYALLVFLLA
jgi:hypothetical protein